jgi:acetyl esterase/lipase
MSLPLAVVRGLLPLIPRSTDSADSLHEAIRSRKGEASVTDAVRKVAHVSERDVDGMRVVRLEPRHAHRSDGRGGDGRPAGPRPHLIYTHGGCYTFPLRGLHWDLLARLIRAAGVSVDVPLYGLAPEHTASDAYPRLERVYRDAVASHEGRVFLGGDSAGGGLALGQALVFRDAGLAAPRGILLISPWLDVTMTNPGIADVAPRDPLLAVPGLVEAGRLWAGDLDVRDPRVSPLYGDLEGLAPVHTFQGDRDILAPDAFEATRRLKRAGTAAELRLTRGGFHVFPAVGVLPEAKLAVRRMAAILGS